jgi:outer membrane PBP1 activator LpoA protein
MKLLATVIAALTLTACATSNDAYYTAIADSTDASITAYAQTLSTVFKQCTREYSELAAKAGAHALDTETLFTAWKAVIKKE